MGYFEIYRITKQTLVVGFQKNAQGRRYDCIRLSNYVGKGGKTRKRGKNDNEGYKRELEFKEDGQGRSFLPIGLIT